MNTTLDSDNATLEVYPCDLPPVFPPSLNIPPSIDYIQAVVALVLGVTGFLLNLFILLMVSCYKILHQRIMYLALQIVIIDIIYTLTISPVSFVSGVSRAWLFGDVMCNIFGIIHDFFAMFRFTTTLVLTLDRFISVFWPFFYSRKSSHFVLTLGGVMYVVSTLRGLLPVTGIMGCYVYIPAQKTCTAYSGCSDGCFGFVAGATSIVVIFGALIPFGLYAVLFYKIRRIKRQYTPPLGTSSFGDYSEKKVGDISPNPGIIEAKNGSSFDARACTPPVDKPRLDSAPAAFGSRLSFVPITGMECGISTYSIPAEVGSVRSDVGSNDPSNCDVCLQHKTGFTENQSVEADETVSSDISGHQKASNGISGDFFTKSQTPSSQNTTCLTSNNTHIASTVEERRHDPASALMSPITIPVPADGDHRLKSRTERPNVRANVTMFILLMSVIGCTAPAFVLYTVQQFLLKPAPALFIVNMLVGRTFFNLLPVVDSFAIMRHQEFRMASNKLLGAIKRKLRNSYN